ncbi:hypothetical protein G6F49_001188 [Rhizopus delemar]|nr:hypothetical protein G6F49_001188 [Rhizopus delemar]
MCVLTIKATYASEDDAYDSSSTDNQNMSTEEFDIANHLNEGKTQFKLFAGSSLLNLDDERLTGLVNEETLQEIKDDTILPPFKLSEATTTLLAKIGGSVPSSRKLRSIIRKSIGENNDSDLMEIPIDQSFSQWIGSLSYNSLLNGKIFLPRYIAQYHSLTTFVDSIYPKDIMEQTLDPEFFQERTIIASKNDLVDEINRYVLDQLPGNKISLFSVDRVTQEDSTGSEGRQMPTKYLQSLSPDGLPPSVLELKVGMSVMILRNINLEKGLCNGTRVTVLSIGEFLLKVKLPGVDGRVEVIPRFTLSTLENEYPFTLTRNQFPVRPSFAMTINKSQGQSLKIVGADLRLPVLTHGQLYVALSRVTSVSGLSVLLVQKNDVNSTKTENIVYLEILLC